ncbi:MAG: GNAT family protein [Dehalococcoidia bacterium]|jgi:RimJ/RimL family protein N-acetyltransferase|nr:GNAT family protein [Dehalococcoidia bacterium]MDP6227578.1 GNAT family protein [Dehalococcoidia bacterium]MDP7084781.1 GNAT family protein [Dehalococcoidia bacterium]MDP7201671.1 GNAT family protein [Dehalococcoidia bacterium]MDP7511553.1 GNAT family protein [Dehalococcoidia bacterium]
MRIATERLLLRDFVTDDWPDVLAYQRDPRYLQFYPWADRTEAEVRRFVKLFVDQQTERPRRNFQFAITFPDGGQVIGNIGIRRKPENDWEADIGYELAPEYWGRGYATEAALAIVDFGFRELGLHRISSWCIADNAASARVLERVGLRPEGRLRENEHFKGRWWDTLLYGLLESEWRTSATSR